MRSISWHPEPRWAGNAEHAFLDAAGVRVELLAYDCQATSFGGRMCGFEIFVRERLGGPFHLQVAAGEADCLAAAKAAALQMVCRPRAEWHVQDRSWLSPEINAWAKKRSTGLAS